ncbi:MAG: hypothetical protein M1821_007154 [Bathelium mastoideum]|nr:MAG: hypothetical protein M1821_007154 [Bathelium mastoideum]
MAGVGEASAIIAVAETGLKLSSALLEYIRDVRDAPARIKRVANVIDTTSGQLKEVGELVRENDRRRVLSALGVRTATRCSEECAEIIKNLRLTLCKHGWMPDADDVDAELDVSLFSSIQFPFIKSRLDAPRVELDRIKLDLTLILTTASVFQATTTEEKTIRSRGIPELQKARHWAAQRAETAKKKNKKKPSKMSHKPLRRSYATFNDSSDDDSEDERLLDEFIAYQERRYEEEEAKRRREEAALVAAEEARKKEEAEVERKVLVTMAREEFKEELRQEREERETRQRRLKDHLKDELRRLKLPPEQIQSIAENVDLGVDEDADAIKLMAQLGQKEALSNGASIDDDSSIGTEAVASRRSSMSSSLLPWKRPKNPRGRDSHLLNGRLSNMPLMEGLINSGMQLAAWTLDLATSYTVELGHPQEWLRHYLVENLQKDGARGVRMLSQRCAHLSPQSWKVLSDFIRYKNQQEVLGSQIHWVLLYFDHNRPSSHLGVFARSKTPPSLEVILGRQDNRGPSWSFADPSVSRPSSVVNGTEVHQSDAAERSASPLTIPTTTQTAEARSVPDTNVTAPSQSAEAQIATPIESHGRPGVQSDSNDRFLKPSGPTKSSMKTPSSQSASRTDPLKVSFEDLNSESRRPDSPLRESAYNRGDRSHHGPIAPEHMYPLTYSARVPHMHYGYDVYGSHRGMPAPPPLTQPSPLVDSYYYPPPPLPRRRDGVNGSDRRQGSMVRPPQDDDWYYSHPPPSTFYGRDDQWLDRWDQDESSSRSHRKSASSLESQPRTYKQQPRSTYYDSRAPFEHHRPVNRYPGLDVDSDEDAESKFRRKRGGHGDVSDDLTMQRREDQKRSLLKAELRRQKERQQKEESYRKGPEPSYERGDLSSSSYQWNRRHSPSPSPPPLSRRAAHLYEKLDKLMAEALYLEKALRIARERGDYARADDLQFGAIPQVAEDIKMINRSISEAEGSLEGQHDKRVRSSRDNADYASESGYVSRSVDSHSREYLQDEWALVPARDAKREEMNNRTRESMFSDGSDERSELDEKPQATPDQTVTSTLNDNEIILKALKKYTTFEDKMPSGSETKATTKQVGKPGKTKIPKRLADRSILLRYGRVEEESDFAEGPEKQTNPIFVLDRALSIDEIDEVIKKTDRRRRPAAVDVVNNSADAERPKRRAQDSAYNEDSDTDGSPESDGYDTASGSETSVTASGSSNGSTQDAEKRVLGDDEIEVIEDVSILQGREYHPSVDSDQISLRPDDSASQLSRTQERANGDLGNGKAAGDIQPVYGEGVNGTARDLSVGEMANKTEKSPENNDGHIEIVSPASQSVASLDAWDRRELKKDKLKEREKSSEKPSGTQRTDTVEKHEAVVEIIEEYPALKEEKTKKVRGGFVHGQTSLDPSADDERSVSKSNVPKESRKRKKKQMDTEGRPRQQTPNRNGQQQDVHRPTFNNDEEVANPSPPSEPEAGQENGGDGEQLESERAFVLSSRSRTTTVEDADEDPHE